MRMSRSPGFAVLFCAGLFLFSSCSAIHDFFSSEVGPEEGEAVVGLEGRESLVPPELILGPEDTLNVEVWRQDDLTRQVRVNRRGAIYLPLVGEIPLAGLTPSQLRDDLTERFKEYIRNPQVSVDLLESPNQKAFILGEVTRPGSFDINGLTSVLQVVAEAGGFTGDANLRSVVLVRGHLENPIIQRIDLEAALSGQFSQDLYLMRGDIVYVNRTFIADIENFAVRLTNIINPIHLAERTIILGSMVPDAFIHGDTSTRLTIN